MSYSSDSAGQGGSPFGTQVIGRVVSVDGAQAAARLDVAPAAAGQHPLQIGSMVKMGTVRHMVFAMVKGLRVPDPDPAGSGDEIRIMELELVGEGLRDQADAPMEFRRGVSFYPTLGDAVYMASKDDLSRIYEQPSVSSVRIGSIYQDQSLPAFVSVDDLLGKHFAVLGTTGSGKSCAISTILRAIVTQHQEGHILLLDLHGEYGSAFRDCAELRGAGEFKLPYWLLNFEEMQEIVVEKTEEEETDKAILREAIVAAKQNMHADSEWSARFDSDSPVPYRIRDVLRWLNEAMGKLDRPTGAAPYLRLRNRIDAMLVDRRFGFMFDERFAMDDDMGEILGQLFRVPSHGKPLTILDLSSVPTDIMKVVISLLCRLAFDFAYWGDGNTPVLLVCEEAHRYAARTDESGFALTRRALSRIGNEGRKYGISLGLVSQRPSELDLGILSQCNTIFAMRMNNMRDQEYVKGTLSESGLGLTDALPSLRTGEAVVVGEALSVPARVYLDFLPAEQRPSSGTAEFAKSWKTGEGKDNAVAAIVERWRRQRR